MPKHGGTVHHPLIDDARALQWMANQNCITPHVWNRRVPDLEPAADPPADPPADALIAHRRGAGPSQHLWDALIAGRRGAGPSQHSWDALDVQRRGAATARPWWDQPDLCVFDLDPARDEPEVLRAVMLALRDLLAEDGLPSRVKTSGSKGFHVAVPLDGTASVDAVAAFAHRTGAELARRDPDHLTLAFSKADRGGRIYVDTGRNEYTMAARLDAVGDLWADLLDRAVALPARPVTPL